MIDWYDASDVWGFAVSYRLNPPRFFPNKSTNRQRECEALPSPVVVAPPTPLSCQNTRRPAWRQRVLRVARAPEICVCRAKLPRGGGAQMNINAYTPSTYARRRPVTATPFRQQNSRCANKTRGPRCQTGIAPGVARDPTAAGAYPLDSSRLSPCCCRRNARRFPVIVPDVVAHFPPKNLEKGGSVFGRFCARVAIGGPPAVGHRTSRRAARGSPAS